MTHPTVGQAPDPAFQQQFGRSRGPLVGAAVVVLAVALWVGAVQLGGSDPAPTPRPDASAPAVALEPSPSALPRPSLPPVLELFGPAPPGPVLIRDTGIRSVDLATGLMSDHIGATGYLDRMLSLPDGRFVCVCVRQRTRGEERTHEVEMETFDGQGERLGRAFVGRWVGVELPGLHQEPGPFSLDAAHSADGRYVALTTSLRRPPDWLREVLVFDVDAGRVVARASLPTTSSADPPNQPRWAWAPSPRFSPDGRTLLLSGVEVDVRDGPVGHHSWLVPLDGGQLGDVIEAYAADDPSNDPCRDAFPDFASNELVFTLCLGDPFAGPFLRRVTVDGTSIRRVSLRDALKDSAAPHVLTDGRGMLWMWDAWSTRAIRMDAEEGVVAATTAMPTAGTPQRFLSPPAVLTPDASQLVVAVTTGIDDAGAIHVLDAITLESVGVWNVDPRLRTLGVSKDGQWLLLGHGPEHDIDGRALGPSRLVVAELETGTIRARLGRLGEQGFTLVTSTDQAD